MSSKNIFEVLQNIAENTESNKKFLNILKENGFTGTLEEAENQINQQTQVVLNNLTTEDLQNIAGGKSLMNDKLKKALAVGGASLMAAGTVMPSGSALNMANVKDKFKEYTDKGSTYIGKHPIHSATTAALALIAGTLIIKNISQGRPNAVLSSNEELLPYLYEKDLSEDKKVLKFIAMCVAGLCEVTVKPGSNTKTLQFTGSERVPLKGELWDESDNPEYTIDTLLETFVSLMAVDDTYVNRENKLTNEGAEVINTISEPIRNLLNCVIKNAKTNVEKESSEEEEVPKEDDQYQTAVEEAEKNLQTFTENKTKLGHFLTELLAYVHGLLDRVNGMETGDSRRARMKEVKKFTDESSDEFENAWNGFTNVNVLTNDRILNDEIKNEIKNAVAAELKDLATYGEKSDVITSNGTRIYTAVHAPFKSFLRQEAQLKKQVEQAKNAQKSAKDTHIDTVTIPQAKTFKEGETLTLKQASPTANDN